MNRELPILFNTEMVQAILDGRKTVTRRLPSKRLEDKYLEYEEWAHMVAPSDVPCKILTEKEFYEQNTRYQVGDILYVRETWAEPYSPLTGYAYRASCDKEANHLFSWRPSIHMPKEAARIWLKVTDVRVERLQDIMKDPPGPNNQIVKEGCRYGCDFIALWDSTIKKSELPLYGWDANPWVFVYEFERIQKPC